MTASHPTARNQTKHGTIVLPVSLPRETDAMSMFHDNAGRQRAQRGSLTLLHTSIFIVALLGLSLLAFSFEMPADTRSAQLQSFASTNQNRDFQPTASSPAPVDLAEPRITPRPESVVQHKFLAVLLSAVAASLVWLWRHISPRG